MADKKPLTDAQLATMLREELSESIKYNNSELSKEREEALDYYNLRKPHRLHKGSSSYVSADVYDAIEAARAGLQETFSGNSLPVYFEPYQSEAKELARVATSYVNHVIFEQNNGFLLLDDLIFDSLMARVGVVKVYWKEQREEDYESDFAGLTMDEVEEELVPDNAELGKLEASDPDTNEFGEPLYDGSIIYMKDSSKVALEVIEPEDFLISTQATDISDGPVGHRVRRRRSEWMNYGIPKEKLDKLKHNTDDEWYSQEEKNARHLDDEVTEGWNQTDLDPEITLIEVYADIDMQQNGESKLYRVLLGGDEILEKEEVSFRPFVCYKPLRQSHVFHGQSFARTLFQTQNAKTTLTRGVLDHTLLTTNPRMTVVKGGVMNMKEVLENRFGGVINLNKPDAVKPLEQASMNPFVFNTLQLLDADKEKNTGVSQLSQGLNKDAVSKQNSQGMMQDLVNLSQQRLRIMARRLAEEFFKPLAELVYRLVVMYEREEKVMMIAGNYVTIDPTQWAENRVAKVHLHLSPEARENQASKIINAYSLIANDPEIAPAFPFPKRREKAVEALELMGFTDAGDWLMEQPPKPQPGPMQILELEMKKAEVEEKKISNQATIQDQKLDQNKEIMKIQQQMGQLQLDSIMQARKQALEERKQTHTEEIDWAEFEQAKQTEDTRGIMSPG